MNSRIIILITASFFVTAFSLHSRAQQDSVPLQTMVDHTQKLLGSYPIEKVHLHFDKPYYAVGDTLWYKAYLTSNLTDYQWSKIVYVELLNSKDSLLRTWRLPLTDDHTASGYAVLDPENFRQDNYRVRAYTQWMINFGPDYFFDKVVPIGDALRKQVNTRIDFKDLSAGNTAQAQASIIFRDHSNRPYGNRKVSWEVVSNFETIARGRGETGADGALNIAVSSEKKEQIRAGRLVVALTLNNPAKPVIATFPLRSALADVDVQFFPEGGELLNDIETVIAFKAIGNDGLGRTIKGEVVDKDNQVVASFASEHLGMGKFSLQPQAGNTYSARVQLPGGEMRTYRLPRVKAAGIGLAVNNTDSAELRIRITANDVFFERNKGKGFYIMAQANGMLCYAAQATLRNNVIQVAVPKDKFPAGVTQITLFSSRGQPLSERVAFIYRKDMVLDLAVKSDRPTYGIKQKVLLDLGAKAEGEAVSGTFSVSVTDETKVPYADEDDVSVLSNMLLSADLRGYVEKPNYYFIDTDNSKLAHLDLLLLTQGYRRVDYRNVLAGKYPEVHLFPEQGVDVTGTVRLRNGLPAVNAGLTISIPDRRYTAETRTDESGRFRFPNLVFSDSSSVTINGRGNDNYRDLVISVDGGQFPTVNRNVNTPSELLNIDTALEPYLQNSQKTYRSEFLLDEVEIVAKPVVKPSHKDYPALSGLGMMADHTIDGANLSGCNVLLMCLQTAAMGLTFEQENFYVTRDYNAGSRVPVQVFLNGMAVDVHALNTVTPAEVESIEIFTRDELGTVNRTYQTNGVLVVHTKKKPQGEKMSLADLEKLIPKSNVVTFTPLGFLKKKEFYVPKYVTQESRNISDLRTTVHWAPDVITDAEGNARLEFYNADGKGSYRIVVEGMDKAGRIGRQVYRYTVQ